MTMNKLDFIEYSASRYGIDFSVAETFVDMFSSCLSELLDAGQSVDIDGIGEFEKIPLFPNGLNHQSEPPRGKPHGIKSASRVQAALAPNNQSLLHPQGKPRGFAFV